MLEFLHFNIFLNTGQENNIAQSKTSSHSLEYQDDRLWESVTGTSDTTKINSAVLIHCSILYFFILAVVVVSTDSEYYYTIHQTRQLAHRTKTGNACVKPTSVGVQHNGWNKWFIYFRNPSGGT